MRGYYRTRKVTGHTLTALKVLKMRDIWTTVLILSQGNMHYLNLTFRRISSLLNSKIDHL